MSELIDQIDRKKLWHDIAENIVHIDPWVLDDLNEIVMKQPTVYIEKWIPVTEHMPEEHDSIFKRFYKTAKWDKCMWLKKSDEVIITSELKYGTRITEYSYTHDGKWCFLSDVIERKVIAWRPLPESYKGEKI